MNDDPTHRRTATTAMDRDHSHERGVRWTRPPQAPPVKPWSVDGPPTGPEFSGQKPRTAPHRLLFNVRPAYSPTETPPRQPSRPCGSSALPYDSDRWVAGVAGCNMATQSKASASVRVRVGHESEGQRSTMQSSGCVHIRTLLRRTNATRDRYHHAQRDTPAGCAADP